jgi:hypothetical protein
LKLSLQRTDPNPYIAAVSFKIPRSAPTVQRTAQLQLQSFCKAILHGLTAPPQSIEVEWTQKGKLQDMAVYINIPNEQRIVQSYPNLPAHSDNNPFLVQVQGILPLDPIGEAYSIYAFQNKQGFGSDIVSNELFNLKRWEQTSIFNHITQLDLFARVRFLFFDQHISHLCAFQTLYRL